MTRVLVLGSRPQPETFLQRLFEGLAATGFDMVLAVGDPRMRRNVAPMLNSAWLPARGEGTGARLRVSAWLIAQRRFSAALTSGDRSQLRRRAIADLAPDVIYFPWNSGAVGDEDVFDLGIPTVISCRGSQVLVRQSDPAQNAFTAGVKRTLAKADAVHCVSDHLLRTLATQGLDRSKATVIRPAVDPSLFAPSARAADISSEFRIVMAGRLIWMKGVEYAVIALARLRTAGVNARLVIAGEGPERARVLYTASDLGVAPYVELLGRLSPEGVRRELRRADACWVSSISEGISNVALEAMSCGVPIVTTSAGGMPEAVTDGVEGFVVPVRDPEAMARATARLAGDVRLRMSLGQSARQRVLREFRLEDQIELFGRLLNNVQTQRTP